MDSKKIEQVKGILRRMSDDMKEIRMLLNEFETPVAYNLAEKLGLDLEEIQSSSRIRVLSDARAVMAHELRKKNMSLSQIAKILHRDHSTVINCIARYKTYYEQDPNFRSFANKITA